MPIPELVWFDVTAALEKHRAALETYFRSRTDEDAFAITSTLGAVVDAMERYQRSLNPEAWDKAREELGLPRLSIEVQQ